MKPTLKQVETGNRRAPSIFPSNIVALLNQSLLVAYLYVYILCIWWNKIPLLSKYEFLFLTTKSAPSYITNDFH